MNNDAEPRGLPALLTIHPISRWTRVRRALARGRPTAAVSPRAPDELFWPRWARECADRLESWQFVLAGLASAALGVFADPVAGVVFGAAAVSLVAGWSVLATWLAQRDEAREAATLALRTHRELTQLATMATDLRSHPAVPLADLLTALVAQAHRLEIEKPVRGDGWFVEAVGEWSADARDGLIRARAGDLLAHFDDAGIGAPTTASAADSYLRAHVGVLEAACKKMAVPRGFSV